MKKQQFFLSLIFLSTTIFSQTSPTDFKPSGAPLFKVFWNYHSDLSKNATKTSAFELNRAYLGYQYTYTKALSAKVIFDISNNTGGSNYTVLLKNAQLDWNLTNDIKLSMGLIGMKQFNDQEEFWGYRYLFKSFQDENGFGSSADLGINAEFKLSKTLKANFIVFNGEGFKSLQDEDGNQKVGGSLVFIPVKGLTTKIYVDNQPTTGSKAITSLALFAGYQAIDWRFGAEFNKLNNGKKFSTPAVDNKLDGVSFYATYIINKKVEVFGRYDQLSSNTLTGQTTAWNLAKDGSQLITGVQYTPTKGVKFALNYQGFSFDAPALDAKSLVFLSVEFKL
ncbi:MAG: hypothetical protein COZ76_05975 [Flavobacteriales bacterium CG_4_8_14_3_um_filter_35_10]|nr:hypothetical protein [Zetaproteobacteria bacterium]OIO11774.1 MAG: hypothetical protein AUJ53_03800 [Flavobacteriaceae bacterium CG1_02_35_72]PIX06977.1 MAG: hypothetical protein COZ76_05975 [Flavobacteriales bacterium CG_4_8_14_3_um_filter_35_10]PJA05800.1 MAG: hypothetical protein COX71_04845 [Flavobacteriales bacterium CG_4_10_14_0_2_um_filter_35_18]